MLPLAENIWPQIRIIILPSALLLNSSAKIRLGLKVYKISQESHLVFQWLYWWPVYFRAAALPSPPRGAAALARAFLYLLREDVKTFWAQSARPELSNGQGWRPREEREMVFHREQ